MLEIHSEIRGDEPTMRTYRLVSRGTQVAICVVELHDMEEATIEWLCVQPNYRRLGYGSKLLRYICGLEEMQDRAISLVAYNCEDPQNDCLYDLLRFYEKNGFDVASANYPNTLVRYN